jgi:Ulp1 family protease
LVRHKRLKGHTCIIQLDSQLYVLDSLRTKPPREVLDNIKTYLYFEAKARYHLDLQKDRFQEYLAHVSTNITRTMYLHSSYQQVPLQDNFVDCGVCMLHFMELFLKDPEFYSSHIEVIPAYYHLLYRPLTRRIQNELPDGNYETWTEPWKAQEMLKLRATIRQAIVVENAATVEGLEFLKNTATEA